MSPAANCSRSIDSESAAGSLSNRSCPLRSMISKNSVEQVSTGLN